MELTIVPSDLAFDAVSNDARADLGLIRQFRAGDRDAFAALYQAYQTLREPIRDPQCSPTRRSVTAAERLFESSQSHGG